jgi:hypothetical protein
MKTVRSVILNLLLGTCLQICRAQEAVLPETTHTVSDAVAAPFGAEQQSPVKASAPLNPPAPAKDDVIYHLDTGINWRRPANGNYDWLTLGTLFFGKMLNEHNALDAGFGGGVMQLKRGGPADAQAHQPAFVELGIVWRYYPIAPETTWNPYVTAGTSLIWMSWEYRTPVDTKDYGLITRDYLEGIDGFAGVGLRLRGWKHLDFFSEVDVGGTGFMPTTSSGEHNNLFPNFGYVGIKGGLSLKF